MNTYLHGNLVVREREEFLPKPVSILLLPLLLEEPDNLLPPLHETVTVPPHCIGLPHISSKTGTLGEVGVKSENIPCTRGLPSPGSSCSRDPGQP